MAQEVTSMKASNTDITNEVNQEAELKEMIKHFFTEVLPPFSEEVCLIKNVLAPSVDKWSLFIIFNLGYKKTLRFNQLKRRIEGISSRMLSITLKKLEKSQIVKREIFAEVPPRVEYELTEFGQGFSMKMMDLTKWFVEQQKILQQNQNY